jgi:uncharacterized protein (TIGR03437 family)
MNTALLQAGDSYVRTQCPNRFSFLVIRNGYLVWERYYQGMSQNVNAHVMSISKSVLSLLIGQALDQRRIDSLDRKMVDYFPEYLSSSTDARERQITLRQMITMSAGFQWDEVATGPSWVASKDWYKFIIDLPLAANPGEVFNYDTGLSHLLAGVLSRASNQTALAFGNQYLFEPLGIRNFRWDTDPRGNYVGGFRMYFTSRDLAKFGYLVLRHGFWDGRQLVSRSWIEDSTLAKMLYASPTTIGDYCYYWWTKPQAGYPVIMAAGWGGQYIFIVPGLDLILVSTADDTNDGIDLHMQAFNLLTQYVIPSIRSLTDPQVAGAPHIDAVETPVSGSWSAIFGRNLSLTTRAWNQDEIIGGNLPVQLDEVSVTIGGRPAYIGYVSPQQLNVLVPGGIPSGQVSISVTSAPAHTTTTSSTLKDVNPALFLWKDRFAAAQHADFTGVNTLAPARPGETILLYGSGFGRTAPSAAIGEIARETCALVAVPVVTVGGIPAVVEFAGIPQGTVGLYQINVRVPQSVVDGDLPVDVIYQQVEAPLTLLPVRR